MQLLFLKNGAWIADLRMIQAMLTLQRCDCRAWITKNTLRFEDTDGGCASVSAWCLFPAARKAAAVAQPGPGVHIFVLRAAGV